MEREGEARIEWNSTDESSKTLMTVHRLASKYKIKGMPKTRSEIFKICLHTLVSRSPKPLSRPGQWFEALKHLVGCSPKTVW